MLTVLSEFTALARLMDTQCIYEIVKFYCFSRGPRICDTEKCKSLTTKVKQNAIKSLQYLQNITQTSVPEKVDKSKTPITATRDTTTRATVNKALSKGDAGVEKSKDVSSLVLEEIKKIQKNTEKHRIGQGAGGASFR